MNQGVASVSRSRVNDHSLSFVDEQEVLIFEKNV
jgi:hypothetical protein